MSASTFFVSLPDLDQHCLVCGASMRGFSARSEPCFDWLAKPGSAFQHVPVCRPSIWSSSERCYDGSAGHGSSQTGSARPEARTAADKYWGTIAAKLLKSTPAKSVFLTPAIVGGEEPHVCQGKERKFGIFRSYIFPPCLVTTSIFPPIHCFGRRWPWLHSQSAQALLRCICKSALYNMRHLYI